MSANYTRQELEGKKVTELRVIMKELKVRGPTKKADMIDRILNQIERKEFVSEHVPKSHVTSLEEKRIMAQIPRSTDNPTRSERQKILAAPRNTTYKSTKLRLELDEELRKEVRDDEKVISILRQYRGSDRARLVAHAMSIYFRDGTSFTDIMGMLNGIVDYFPEDAPEDFAPDYDSLDIYLLPFFSKSLAPEYQTEALENELNDFIEDGLSLNTVMVGAARAGNPALVAKLSTNVNETIEILSRQISYLYTIARPEFLDK